MKWVHGVLWRSFTKIKLWIAWRHSWRRMWRRTYGRLWRWLQTSRSRGRSRQLDWFRWCQRSQRRTAVGREMQRIPSLNPDVAFDILRICLTFCQHICCLPIYGVSIVGKNKCVRSKDCKNSWPIVLSENLISNFLSTAVLIGSCNRQVAGSIII